MTVVEVVVSFFLVGLLINFILFVHKNEHMIDYAGLFNVILSLSLNCGFFYVTVLTGESSVYSTIYCRMLLTLNYVIRVSFKHQWYNPAQH